MMRSCQRAILVIAILLTGCEPVAPPAAFRGPVISKNREQLYQQFDHEVVLVGKAQSSDRGSFVLMNDGTRVRVPDIARWPDKVNGQKVTVGGMLKRWIVSPAGDDEFTLQGAHWVPGDSILEESKKPAKKAA